MKRYEYENLDRRITNQEHGKAVEKAKEAGLNPDNLL